jgi:mRNA interferase MazF
MTYKRGDLALVPFPFTDLSSAKRRPVLLLVDPDGYDDFLAVAVTSRPHHSNAIAIRDQSPPPTTQRWW